MNHRINLLMFSGDYDKALAGFILANSAKDIGLDVTMFFAFGVVFNETTRQNRGKR